MKTPISVNPIRTIVIDDEQCACDRMKKLLAPIQNIEVIGYYTNSVLGFENVLKEKPDLLFLDVELENNVSAFDIIRQLEENEEKTNIILVTAYPHYSIKAIKHRVFDYLLKPVDIDELEDTLKRFSEYIFPKLKIAPGKFSMLSKRESMILEQVLNGKSSREIALSMFLSVHTVNTHRRSILKKTGARSSVELFKMKKMDI